ncbi:MAG: PilZ domain-containing protein [Xanthomonadaceae bacterium]|jgi:hypothetical protein|nr:PilZ domain-containing protein [Xanthomonadaceae bacterium]
MSPHIARHALRRQVTGTVPAADVMTSQDAGMLIDLSENGMMLLGGSGLLKDGLYQLRFPLEDRGRVSEIDVGVHLLWLGQPNTQGLRQAGFRFLTISDEDRERIRRWIESGDNYSY